MVLAWENFTDAGARCQEKAGGWSRVAATSGLGQAVRMRRPAMSDEGRVGCAGKVERVWRACAGAFEKLEVNHNHGGGNVGWPS